MKLLLMGYIKKDGLLISDGKYGINITTVIAGITYIACDVSKKFYFCIFKMRNMIEKDIEALGLALGEDKLKIVVSPHISPDGDAAGSCSALCQVLTSKGHKVTLVSQDHFPEYLHYLDYTTDCTTYIDQPEKCQEVIEEADLYIMLDHNVLHRAGKIGEIVEASFSGKIAMIDHHLEPMHVDYRISDSNMSSTCELLYIVIKHIWGEDVISASVANAIYTGINTDTGGFSHNSSRSSLYRIVADLLDLGLDKEFVHNQIYRQNNLSRLRLMGNTLLNKLHVDKNYPLALMPITQKELTAYGYQEGDLEGLVNIPLSVKNISVSIQITEREDKIKLSFRSKDSIPVNEWSKAYFDGGGHRNAAGGVWHGTIEEAIERVESTAAWFFSTYCD